AAVLRPMYGGEPTGGRSSLAANFAPSCGLPGPRSVGQKRELAVAGYALGKPELFQGAAKGALGCLDMRRDVRLPPNFLNRRLGQLSERRFGRSHGLIKRRRGAVLILGTWASRWSLRKPESRDSRRVAFGPLHVADDTPLTGRPGPAPLG